MDGKFELGVSVKDGIDSMLIEYGEYALDTFFEDISLKNIPIVGTAFSLIKIGKGIHENIFLCKLKSFLKNIDENPKWKERFSNEGECKKIAKHLLYVIDACDEDDKLELIGLAFNYFVNEKLDSDEFFYVVDIISKSFYPYLEVLMEIDEADERIKNDGSKYDYYAITHLLNIGLLDFDGQTPFLTDSHGRAERPSIIVAQNGYSVFLRELLKAHNQS